MASKTFFKPGSMGLLQPIHCFLDDPDVSEILLNQPGEVWVEKGTVLTHYPLPDFHQGHLDSLFQLIANETTQRLSKTHPLLSGNLPDGSRIQLVLPPTAKHHTFSIRRKVVRSFSLDYYQDNGFFDQVVGTAGHQGMGGDSDTELLTLYHQSRWPEFLKLAIKARKNIVVSGGTSSGKTTFLNACLKEVNADCRMIVLEDTREIEAPHMNQVQLLASKGGQGEAKVSMQALVQCCLRLRPDRILVGEVRGAEIADFVAACSTGHEGSFTSLHANNTHLAFSRMVQMYKFNHVPSMTDKDILNELKNAIDIIIQLRKTDHGRKITEIWYQRAEQSNHAAVDQSNRRVATVPV